MHDPKKPLKRARNLLCSLYCRTLLNTDHLFEVLDDVRCTNGEMTWSQYISARNIPCAGEGLWNHWELRDTSGAPGLFAVGALRGTRHRLSLLGAWDAGASGHAIPGYLKITVLDDRNQFGGFLRFQFLKTIMWEKCDSCQILFRKTLLLASKL